MEGNGSRVAWCSLLENMHCRSNARLREDPEEDMDIIKQAVQFIDEKLSDMSEKGGSWKHYVVGHSLGGAVASCVAVALSDKLEQ